MTCQVMELFVRMRSAKAAWRKHRPMKGCPLSVDSPL